jgi:hypothetical protein
MVVWFGRFAVFATVSASRHRSTDLILYLIQRHHNNTHTQYKAVAFFLKSKP